MEGKEAAGPQELKKAADSWSDLEYLWIMSMNVVEGT